MKKVLLAISIIILLIILISPGQEVITLRISWWGSQTRHDQTLKVIELFEKKYPNIKLKPEYTGWSGYYDKMAAQAAGGNLPDIMQKDIKFLNQYIQNDLLLPLDQFVKNKLIDLSNVDKASISAGVIGGKLYAINIGNNAYGVFYDPQMFTKARVPYPKPSWTWEDYMDTARKLHKALGIYADTTICNAGDYAGFEHYLRQHGYKLFDDSGKKLGYDEDWPFVEFYSMDVQLTKEGVFAPPEVRLESRTVENDLLVVKKAAMAHYWSNQIVAIMNAAKRPIKIALYPNSKKQVRKGTYLKPSMFWSITKNCKNPEAAAKFIDFFINDIEANKIMMGERGVPVSSKVRNALKPLLTPAQKEMFDFIDLASRNSSPIDPPYPPAFQQILDLLKDLQYKMLYGILTPEQAAKEFRTKANEILAAQK
jgi:multiple sugar transport system substrate-binding protein